VRTIAAIAVGMAVLTAGATASADDDD